MNQTIKEIYERKSVRQYTDQPIEDREKEILFDAIIQAPTAGNMTLYSVIEVKDQNLKEKLAKSCDNQPFIASAPLVLIFLADYKRWYDAFKCYKEDIRKLDVGDLFLSMSDTFIAAQNAVVAAESLGIGSCYIGDIMEDYEYHRELLQLPKNVLPVGMLCFGYPTESQLRRKKPVRIDKQYVFHTDTYEELSTDTLKAMLKEQHGYDDAKLEQWLIAFCDRKYDSDFSVEMSRSVEAMIKSWKE